MRLRHLPVFFLLLFVYISRAQPALRMADSLSAASRYLASNEALEVFLRDNPNRLHDQSRALFLMSYNYLQLGDFRQAEDANVRSMALRDQLRSGDIAENYMRTGAIALQQGNYEKALDHLFIATSMPIEEPRLYALIYGYIASAFEGLGQPEKALNYYHQSLETLQSATEGSQADVATNHYNIGRVYLNQGKSELALASFRQALTVAAAAPSRKDLRGNILNALGEAMREETPVEAVKYYHQALVVYRTAYGERHRETARTYLNLGQLHFLLNEPDSAYLYANHAILSLCPDLESFQGDLSPKISTLCLDRPLLALALNLKAELFLQKAPESRALLAAYENSMFASNLIGEEMALKGDDVSRLRILEATAGIYEAGIHAGYLLSQSPEGGMPWLDMAYTLAEFGKANALRMSLANSFSDSLLPPDIKQQQAALRAAWRNAETLVALHPEDIALRKSAMDHREKFHAFMQKIRNTYPSNATLYETLDDASSALQEQKTRLGKEDVLLSYFIGRTDYYIFALTKTGIFCKKITKSRDFKADDSKAEKLVKKMRYFQEKPMGTGPGVYSKFDESKMATDFDGAIKGFLQSIKKSDNIQFPHYAQLMYERLIQPVDSLLKGKTRLLVVPHKSLFAIPFEALISTFIPDDDSPTGYNKLNYLVKSYTIQYHYAATLAVLGNMKKPQTGFLGMAPVFDNNASQSYIWDSNLFAFDTTYQGSYSMRTATPDGLVFQALPESEREAVNISKLFAKKKKTAQAYLRMEATESRFKENVRGHSIVHLATHSFVNYANPVLSGIAFSQPNIGKPDKEDGILYATEIAGLDLNDVQLVTLSSCESGSGPDAGNEGALSLTHSFLSTGVPNVVSSLWKVYDTYTAQLMQLFYEQALDDKGYAQALRQAKLKMIRESKSADPRKWSGFVLFGAL